MTGHREDPAKELRAAASLLRGGDAAAAADAYRTLLARHPHLVEGSCNLGDALRAAGRLDEAAEVLEEALARRPDLVPGLINLAGVRRLQGRLEEAAACLTQALKRKPYLAAAHCDLGVVRDALGDAAGARESFEAAVDLNPFLADAHFNLGNHYRRRGMPREAETSYRRTIELRPDHVEALNNLGALLRGQDRLKEAEGCFAAAVAADPGRAESRFNLGLVHEAEGRFGEALQAFDDAFAARPSPGLRIKRAMLLPAIPGSVGDLAAARRRLEAEIAAVRAERPRLSDPLHEAGWTNFHLAYHGENDRDLQRATSLMFTEACPSLADDLTGARRPPSDGRLRIGLVSTYFRDHTIGALYGGVVGAIDRERFRVTVFQIGDADDIVNRTIRELADDYRPLPRDLFAARAAIAETAQDLILFTDIGMDPATYFIAHARLAPVQMTTCGHPVTTGIANVDMFLSARHFEPEDAAQDAYSERLVTLDHLLLCFPRPRAQPLPGDRRRLGLDPDRRAYLSAQSLFKHHPAHDGLYVDILRRDPDGILYIPSGHRENWNRLLRARLEGIDARVGDRIRFLPNVGRDDFVRLLAAADVVLDTPAFSGGKTSLESLAVGAATVTMPSPHLRGRFTYGFLRRMGILDTVAEGPEEYVEKAVTLARDRDRRLDLRARILAANHAIFDDHASVRQAEAMWRKAAGTAN